MAKVARRFAGGWFLAALIGAAAAGVVRAEGDAAVRAALGRPVLGPQQTQDEILASFEARVPRLPSVQTAAEWEGHARRLRAAVLEQVVFRGEAAARWRDAKTKVEWLDTIPGGPGYRIKKLRYEALPGLWIPALLYEPTQLAGKVPGVLNVNGHEPLGKSAGYKQVRCINQAKRGMLALNVEWLGFGQLRTAGFKHQRLNQIDLCGSNGVAVFYLAMRRGLDVLLALEHADPARVAVTGLSGGGWQTIFLSALDTRVTLANPVAGYSSFRTHVRHLKDLGDAEMTPCDLATVVDYTHLTALMAPRALLLTYNAKDDCCYEAGYALPPLKEAALPIYRLFGKEEALRTHVNHDPGTHNFEKDNRQALYRMLGDHFYPKDATYRGDELPTDGEVKTEKELAVALPARNADLNTLALGLCQDLPRPPGLPDSRAAAERWQQAGREKLRALVKAKDHAVRASRDGGADKDGLRVEFWKLRLGDDWTVPVVELARGEPRGTALVVADDGRAAAAAEVEALLAAGQRVLAVDPCLLGECRIRRGPKDHTEMPSYFGLLLAAVGDRPLGIQASQLAAVARWAQAEHKNGPVTLVAVGPRSSMAALVAAGLEAGAIGQLRLHAALGSLKELIEQNHSLTEMPEMFCFGLLEAFDVKQLAALTAPRPVEFIKPSARAKAELAGLRAWYATLGKDFEPLR